MKKALITGQDGSYLAELLLHKNYEVHGIIQSIMAREMYKQYLELKRYLWGGKFWTSGYYINTVGQYGNEAVIKEYVKKQWLEYQQIFRCQLKLFDDIA